ncbi:MAG TPA: hypothetical protein VJB57_07195 [Dehalococcoidia bacterium]|nr:hypothetical protein [Dehalococcoidia bacterium]
MSIDNPPGDPRAANPARLLSLPPFGRVGPLVWLPLLIVTAGVIAAVVYLAANFYPDQTPPATSEVEQQAAALFGLPSDTDDGKIVGDLLVERFYAIDVETGERYVADFLKGRIESVQSLGPEGAGPYLALLNLRNLQRDRALYAAFVDMVARPPGNYLGLRAFPGANDAFRLNYEGFLPERRLPFQGPEGENAYDFLLAQKYDEVAKAPRLIRHEGHNYVLNSTEMFPFFRTEFRTGRALFLSELVIVDTTATPQRSILFRLQQQYQTTTTPR